MKRFLIFYLCTAFAAVVNAQTNAATTFDVDGIKVIYKPTVKDIVNVSIYFKGGVTNYAASTAGIENLAINGATQCGTKKYAKDAFNDKADAYGINVYGSAGKDNANIGLYCISKYFNEGWDLLAEAAKNPVFDEGEFNKMKQKVLSGIKQTQSSPDGMLNLMVMENVFAGTPYAINPQGIDSIVTVLTATDAKDYYYKTLLNKARMFIVVVGNVSKADITAKIHAAFADVPTLLYQKRIMPPPVITGNSTNIVERQLATNYIMGAMNAPAYSSPDYIPNRLAFSALYDKLFTEVRTRRNLSYAPSASVRTGIMPYSFLYVTTTDPKAAVEVMANVVNDYKKNGFSQKDLSNEKAAFITSNYMKEESTNAIAASYGNAETFGNWKLADEFPDMINKTTAAEMSNAFKKYITGIKWNYLGDTTKADEAKEAFNIALQ